MSDEIYLKLAEVFDQGPLTAPRAGKDFSQAFIKHLRLLYTPEQAELARHLKLGMKFMGAAELARLTGKSEDEVKAVLDPLCKSGRVIGFGGAYVLPPIPMIFNHHQFKEDTGPDDLEAARLYQQFFVKDGFYKYYESSAKGTQIMRVIPVKRTVRHGQKVLDNEEAHKIISSVKHLRLLPCPCRVRTEKLGIRECKGKYPIASCIMVESSAQYFENLGLGKKVNAEQAIQYLDAMQDLGLVATTENYEDAGHAVICLCCDCCCSQLRGRTRWENPGAVAPANFVAESNEDCLECGDCVERCFFKAIAIDEDKGRAVVDEKKCMGCGVCTLACKQEAMRLKRVEREKPYPGARELYKKVAIENRSTGK
jgi:Pyruvate/2-oxoacid:ferredoxin oxidoreductase delta subunit